MKKIALILLGLISFAFCASAENFSLYSNLDDSNQYCNILIDYYYNTTDFDPFNEYVVFRDTQYSYCLVYGKDLTKDNLSFFRYTLSHNQIPSSLSSGSLSSFSLSDNGYTYVGNISGSLASQQFNEFKYKFIFFLGGFVFMLCFLFKVLKPRFKLGGSSKRYDL